MEWSTTLQRRFNAHAFLKKHREEPAMPCAGREATERAASYTYASKFMLGIQDFSTTSLRADSRASIGASALPTANCTIYHKLQDAIVKSGAFKVEHFI
ncbi:hypothetical protein Aduo_012811 [Ancylostoma duodenale]